MPSQNNKTRKFQVLAPGKLILIGEYAVLHGAQALVAGTAMYASASISESQNSFSTFRSGNLSEDVLKFRLNSGHLEIIGKEISRSHRFIYELLKQMSTYSVPEHSAFDFQVDTSEFYNSEGKKFGLGSSAAATVAAASSLSVYLDLNLSRESLFNTVFAAHHTAQDTVGSGVDIAASIYGGILIYSISTRDQKPDAVDFPQDLYIMPIWTGKSASTTDLVSKLQLWAEANESEYMQLIEAMKEVSAAACLYIKRAESDKFCTTIRTYYNLLSDMTRRCNIPILSSEHVQIGKIVNDAGGVYKSSGAGFGDLGIAFYDDLSIGKRIGETLRKTSFKKMNFKFDFTGVHQIKN
jgi:phosphomevalonate kinase